MRHNHINTKEFAIGAAVGSLLGSVAALLIAPQSGKNLRGEINDVCNNLSEKTCNLAHLGKFYSKQKGCRSCDWVDIARRRIKGLMGQEEEEEGGTGRDLLIGGLAGGILGAVAGLLLAPKSGEDLRQEILDRYEDLSDRTHDFSNGVSRRGKAFAKTARSKANKWLDFAQQVLEEFNEGTKGGNEEIFEKVKDFFHNRRVNDAVDWASFGYHLWRGLKSRR